jgi:hypothetical protein
LPTKGLFEADKKRGNQGCRLLFKPQQLSAPAHRHQVRKTHDVFVTDRFLEVFGLTSLSELPDITQFEEVFGGE